MEIELAKKWLELNLELSNQNIAALDDLDPVRFATAIDPQKAKDEAAQDISNVLMCVQPWEDGFQELADAIAAGKIRHVKFAPREE